MKIKGLGEFTLIERLTKQMINYDGSLLLGIGDDAAAFRRTDSGYMLATCDMLVEGQHFKREWMIPEQLGHKALAVSLSDIAAMGGVPRYALVAAAWPPRMELKYAEGIYRGMAELAEAYGVLIIGGDTVSAPQLILDIMVIGEMDTEPVTRSGAAVGDVFAVTGRLGASAAGLTLLKAAASLHGHSLSSETKQILLRAHLQPEPRVKEAGIMLKYGRPSAMIDISDGLYSEVEHICKGSGIGAEIELNRLPVGENTKQAAAALGKDYQEWVLHGGEDYELLVTLPPSRVPDVKRELAGLGVDFTLIGKATAQKKGILLLDKEGLPVRISKKGYDHFLNQAHEEE